MREQKAVGADHRLRIDDKATCAQSAIMLNLNNRRINALLLKEIP
jgi:hypothetical protein